MPVAPGMPRTVPDPLTQEASMLLVFALALAALFGAVAGAGLLSRGIPVRAHADANPLGHFQPHA